MKITLVNTYDTRGGAAIACKRLREALTANRIETSMLVQEVSKDHPGIFTKNKGFIYTLQGRFRFYLDTFFFTLFEASSRFRFAFSAAITGTDISRHPLIRNADIIHLHWINQGFLSLRDIRKLTTLQKPVVWTLHDMWPFTGGCFHSGTCMNFTGKCGNCFFLKAPHENDLSHRVWKRKEEAFRKLDLHVVTCSNWLANRAKQSSLFGFRSVAVIPNPIDTSVFKPSDRAAARRQLELPQNKFIISMSAFKPLNEKKGFEYLRKALEKLVLSRPELKDNLLILVIGYVPGESPFTLPIEYRITSYIHNEEEMAAYYNASDLFILPSLEENLPNTIMEALACGVPALAFDTGGIKDLIDHQVNGYLAEFGSVEDLANGILWIKNAPGEQLARQARAKVLGNYTYEIVTRQYAALYKNLLQAQ